VWVEKVTYLTLWSDMNQIISYLPTERFSNDRHDIFSSYIYIYIYIIDSLFMDAYSKMVSNVVSASEGQEESIILCVTKWTLYGKSGELLLRKDLGAMFNGMCPNRRGIDIGK
jgi:hypothetical protein